LAERLRRRRHRLLVARRKCAERVLHAVTQLPEHDVRDIERVLAHEINADTFRANQPHHLFDLLFDGRLDVREDQVRFVEKENQLRFLRVANFRKALEQFREQPEKKGRVNLGRLLHELLRRENIDYAAPALGLDQVVEVERGLAEEFVGALGFQLEQTALDRFPVAAGLWPAWGEARSLSRRP
jgi:hypothetical protein